MSNDLAYVAAADNVGTDDDYPGYSTSSSYNTYGDYRYINVAGGAYIIGYTGTATELTIPIDVFDNPHCKRYTLLKLTTAP